MNWYEGLAIILLVILSFYLYWQVIYFKGCLNGLRHELDIKDFEIKNKNIELAYLFNRLKELKNSGELEGLSK